MKNKMKVKDLKKRRGSINDTSTAKASNSPRKLRAGSSTLPPSHFLLAAKEGKEASRKKLKQDLLNDWKKEEKLRIEYISKEKSKGRGENKETKEEIGKR